MVTILVEKMRDDAIIPSKGTEHSSGWDLTILGEVKKLTPDVSLYSTGIKATVSEEGYDLKIYPRSSISKTGFMLANSIGVVDSDYRGELLVALRKMEEGATLEFPCRIVQLIVEKKVEAAVLEVKELDKTVRGEGGFGSTGR